MEGIVIAVNQKKSIRVNWKALVTFIVMSGSSGMSMAGEMPTGANVQSGNVKISGQNSNHLIIDQLRPLRLVRYVELSDKYSTTEKVDAHERLFSKFFSNVESILLDETRVGGHQKERAKDDEKEKELKEIKSV